ESPLAGGAFGPKPHGPGVRGRRRGYAVEQVDAESYVAWLNLPRRAVPVLDRGPRFGAVEVVPHRPGVGRRGGGNAGEAGAEFPHVRARLDPPSLAIPMLDQGTSP